MRRIQIIYTFIFILSLTGSPAFLQACTTDGDCNDGLYCNGVETCISGVCVPGTPPCDDLIPCTTDPCDEDNDNCPVKGCAAVSPADPCCSDPVCEGTDICTAKITLTPKDVWTIPGEIFENPVCLDNPNELVGGIQFDLCEYVDGQPSDCMACIDCELTGRTALFDCVVHELSNGCCKVILFSTHPAGVIIPGLCDIVTIVHESHQDCLEPTCTVQVPKNIIVVEYGGFQLPAYGYQGGVCFLSADADGDGVPDDEDNCPITPNGPDGGTCTAGNIGDTCTIAGNNITECGSGGFCSMDQEDSNNNGIGDACECENATDCNDGLYCNGVETCVDGECKPGTDPCQPLYCDEEGDICYPGCVTNTDCDDGFYCNGAEVCISSACVSGTSPCYNSNPCTTDPCDDGNDICLVKECAAISPSDLCCSDPVCEGADICVAKVTLKPADVGITFDEVLKYSVCLENPDELVGGMQFDLCEYSDGQTDDCMTCTDCELTGRTDQFDCAVNELSNGCCRVILFSSHPAGLINPGQCDIVTVVNELHEDCSGLTCSVQMPKNIIAADGAGFQLPAYGYQGEVCFLSADADTDGVPDDEDNCPTIPNGPGGGTCSEGTNVRTPCTMAGENTSECGPGGFCSKDQEDSNNNGIGDACECENDTDCNDGLYCNGVETCISGVCVPGTPPCDDLIPCTTDPCDEDNDNCPVKGCAAVSPADPCCSDPVCEGTDICTAKVTLKPNVEVTPDVILEKSICLDNPNDLVGGIQFDLCETITDGIPRGCGITCIDCELTGRTQKFDCVVNELSNGCCRVILFSTDPGGLINPGECNIVTVYEFIEDCIGICLDQILENIVAVDDDGFQLPAYGLPVEVCIPCIDDEDCDDGIYCNGAETCVDGLCQLATDPCDDGNDCTDDICYEDLNSCSNTCNATSPFFDPCCDDPACANTLICLSEGLINIEDAWANCGDVGVKKDICLQNLDIPIGGFQMDLCENPVKECTASGGPCNEDADCPSEETCHIVEADPDCLLCTECEMTERSVLFDCVVNELDNGCCRVILFSKNPGGLINPGECNIVTIVYTLKDDPECCNDCIGIDGENIVLVNEYGYDVMGLMAEDGKGWICPYVCGDIDPGSGIYDCGDGDVDIFDILLEVDFALGTKIPDDCQAGPRSNIPTGTPPYCSAPDGTIDILDIMVIIDMVLDRQDCCSYYYGGVIY